MLAVMLKEWMGKSFAGYKLRLLVTLLFVSCSGEVGHSPNNGNSQRPTSRPATPPGFVGNGEAYNGPHLAAESIPVRYDSRQATDRVAASAAICLQGAYLQVAAQAFGYETELLVDSGGEQRYWLKEENWGEERKDEERKMGYLTLVAESSFKFRTPDGVEQRIEAVAEVGYIKVDKDPPPKGRGYFALTVMRESDYERRIKFPDREPAPPAIDLELEHGLPYLYMEPGDTPWVRSNGTIADLLIDDYQIHLPKVHGPSVNFVVHKKKDPTSFAMNTEAYAICLQNYTQLLEGAP